MEGPSLVILKEELFKFKRKKIIEVNGYVKLNLQPYKNKILKDIKTWGKHLLLCFSDHTLRIHFGLFGSYRIDDSKQGSNASIGFKFSNGIFNCYVASVKIIEQPLSEVYDWRLDALSTEWKAAVVKKLLLQQDGKKQIGDLLLDPSIFPAVGNIIRNEVLYRSRLNPETLLHHIPKEIIAKVVAESKQYSLDFLKWKKKNELSKHWEIYTRKKCPLGHTVTKKYTGKTKRRSYICQCLHKYKQAG